MSSEVQVSEDVKALVEQVIARHGLENIRKIKYLPGSTAGDGYVSKPVAVEIFHGGGRLRIFIKCPLDIKSSEETPVEKLFLSEIYFYDVVYPTYVEFLLKKRVRNSFPNNIAQCYGTTHKGFIVALEDLKLKGYELHDRRTVMDGVKMEAVLKTFANFHAVSHAFKDQEKEKYKELVDRSYGDAFSQIIVADGPVGTVRTAVKNFLDKLDPVKDRRILDRCDNLADVLIATLASARSSLNEYSIITQGDCWCNNMMFLYKKDDPSQPPENVILIDWQLLREASPVFDISYFFYTIASEQALDNLDHYLGVYHEELSRRITELSSDPQKLYPLRVLREEWKRHGKFGFAMAFLLIRHMLAAEDEVVSMEGIDFASAEDSLKMYPKLKDETEYIRRMRLLTEHMIRNGLL